MTVSVTTGQRYQNLRNTEVSGLTGMQGDCFPAHIDWGRSLFCSCAFSSFSARSEIDRKNISIRVSPDLSILQIKIKSKLTMRYQDIITIEPGKRGGKPCIRGMRITVYDVLSYLASGMTYEEVLEDFPYLTQEDILACLSYAADHERQTLTIQA